MSLSNSNQKAAMLAKIGTINKVEGFDPAPFAVDYTDLENGEVRKRLPVMIQMAWFRMVYPEGRIAVAVSPGKDCFVATAKVYPSYKDGADCYLAEATASRGYLAEKPSVSPREWAQTAAVGIALRNAGFGLQFSMAGDEFADTAPDELNGTGILNQLRELQVDLRSNPAVFIGGGSLLLRPFLEESPLVAKADFVESPNANALGYELLGRVQLSHRPV